MRFDVPQARLMRLICCKYKRELIVKGSRSNTQLPRCPTFFAVWVYTDQSEELSTEKRAPMPDALTVPSVKSRKTGETQRSTLGTAMGPHI